MQTACAGSQVLLAQERAAAATWCWQLSCCCTHLLLPLPAGGPTCCCCCCRRRRAHLLPPPPHAARREAIQELQYPPVSEQVKKRGRWLHEFSTKVCGHLGACCCAGPAGRLLQLAAAALAAARALQPAQQR
jgi:hypothetical protein